MANDYSGKLTNEVSLLKKRNAELEASAEHTKKYGFEVGKNQDRLVEYNKKIEEIRKNEEKINNLTADRIGLGKQINNMAKGFSGNLLKQLGVESSINLLREARKTKDKEVIKQSRDYAKLLDGVAKGEIDAEEVTRQKVKFTGEYRDLVNQIQKTLIKTPDFSKKAAIEKGAQDKIKEFQKSITDVSDMLSSPAAMGVAVVGLLVQQMVEFAQKALEVRQSLGTSAVDSARIAGNMKLAGINARRFGGSVEQGEAAVTSMAENFGSIDVISASVSMGLGKITGQFGLSGENAGKLLKTMQGINGASIETNLATLETVGNLARAARVAPAAVLNDMAESTETFAKFAMNGGDNLAKAAIEARKLGLNLSTVDKIAESIMDIEGSIANEMEASMLLGRQLSLDKARQLVMEGDMAGMLEEVKRQAGGAAEFAKLDFVQRKALAAAVGLEASELAKLTSEQNNAAKAQEKQAKGALNLAMGIGAIVGLAAALVPAILASIPGLQGVGLRGLAKGLGTAAAGAAGGAVLGAGVGTVMGMEKGGVVKKSGLAQVHKGEAFSGTRNEMGMGSGETNRLLKDLIKQNEFLMNRLTSRIGDIALSN